MSWFAEAGGYQLFCNRDERRTRTAALPPRVQHLGDTRFLAPIDGEAGGTWIAVNHHGLSLCLLNGSGAERPELAQAADTCRYLRPFSAAACTRSRGLILRDLITSASILEACGRLPDADPGCYAPFTLLLLQVGLPDALIVWNGTHLTIARGAKVCMPLISSSFDLDRVRTLRRESFAHSICIGDQPTMQSLFAFHRSHRAGPSAYSTCMHRPDAETVSFSWIRVTRKAATFLYKPSAPCHASPGIAQSLEFPACRL